MSVKNTISITEARKRIFDISDEVQRPGVHYILTDKGRPKSIIMSAEEFESWMETMEVLSDPKAMARIRQAEEEYERGDYMSWDDFKKGWLSEPKSALVLADKSRKKYSVKKKKKV